MKMTIEERQVFVLIDAAYQDKKFCNSEIDLLRIRYGDRLLAKAYRLYQKTDRVQKDHILIYFINSVSRLYLEEFRKELVELFLCDGKFCKFEKRYLRYLNKFQNLLAAA